MRNIGVAIMNSEQLAQAVMTDQAHQTEREF